MKSLKSQKTYLKVLMAVGVVALLGGGAGTFATFNATTTNAGNTFATGTLVLSDKVDSGTACLSTGGGNTNTNANTGCDWFFATSVSKPGDSRTADLTLKNVGSLAASALALSSGACTTIDATAENYHGTGNLCTALEFYVQEWDSAGHTTATHCWYGATTVADTCDFSNTAKTISDFVSTQPVALGGMDAAGGGNDTRYFTIGVKLPNGGAGADNPYQGRQASVDLTWTATQ